MGIRFADFISFFSNIPLKLNNLVSLRPNRVFKNKGRGSGCRQPIKDKDYCQIEIIKGLTDKGQFQ